MSIDLSTLLLAPDCSIREAITRIDQTGEGIALVVDENRTLMGTVTDGDVRRAILAGIALDKPVIAILEQQHQRSDRGGPLTALLGTTDLELLGMMKAASVRHIPLMDKDGRVAGVALMSRLVSEWQSKLTAVVMAGGHGTRLKPLTDDMPKPMLPVADTPLLELLVRQLEAAGVRRVHVTTHYKSSVISDHFGNGQTFGVDIQYVEEQQPLGTAGALSLLEPSNDPILVVNGDIVTDVNFRAMLQFHLDQKADMTIGVRQHEFRLPYGVLELDDVRVCGISEKPVIRQFVNAGIYLLAPEVCRYVPHGQNYAMTDLIRRVIEARLRVVSFPIHEYWQDVGEPEEYRKAQARAASSRLTSEPAQT